MFGFSSLRCIDCEYLDKKDKNRYGEYYCPEARDYVDPNSYTCRYFAPNFYVMTAYSMINHLPFDNYYMVTLINLRDNYMVNNEKGKEFIEEYNVIGKELANKLLNDMYRFDIVNDLEEKYIKPAIEFTLNEDFEMAQNTYIDMIESLKVRYGYSEIKIKRKDFKF